MTDESFGTRLRAYRRAQGISQRELAKRTDLDFSYISKLENERIPPPAADTIVSICNILGIAADELLALTGKLPTNIQQGIGTSKGAQAFLREAQQMGLTDDDWGRMSKRLRSLREKRK